MQLQTRCTEHRQRLNYGVKALLRPSDNEEDVVAGNQYHGTTDFGWLGLGMNHLHRRAQAEYAFS
jgi:hypothetical protein